MHHIINYNTEINEKESTRKNKGVYYTPDNVVRFILTNSIKLFFGKLRSNNLHIMDLNRISYSIFCYDKTLYDPICGTGVFLLADLKMKFNLLRCEVHVKLYIKLT